MTRVKRGVQKKAKHVKLLKSVKGYWMRRKNHIKSAKEAYLHAGQYAYAGRKKRKRDFRRLWILRISQAAKQIGLNYSQLIPKLKAASIKLDRKALSWLVTNDNEAFREVIKKVNG